MTATEYKIVVTGIMHGRVHPKSVTTITCTVCTWSLQESHSKYMLVVHACYTNIDVIPWTFCNIWPIFLWAAQQHVVY